MFKIFKIYFPNMYSDLIEPAVVSLGEYSEFSETLEIAKTHLELIDFAPDVIIKEMSTNELTEVSPWKGARYNIQGQCHLPGIHALNNDGLLI